MDLGLVHAVSIGKMTLEQAKAAEAELAKQAKKAAAPAAKPKDGGKK